MSPEAAAAWGAAGVPPEEAWERARAGEAPPGVEPAPAAKPKERKGAIVSAARALKAAPGRIASNTGLGVLARGTKAAVELTDEQYPLVVKDVSEALKEFGVDISPKELEKKVPRPKGGLLSSLLELLREPAETDFTPAPY